MKPKEARKHAVANSDPCPYCGGLISASWSYPTGWSDSEALIHELVKKCRSLGVKLELRKIEDRRPELVTPEVPDLSIYDALLVEATR